MKNIAIFASGAGSNAARIMDVYRNSPEISIVLVVSNKPDAGVLEIAASNGVPTRLVDRATFYHTQEILNILNERRVDLLVLAGFLWLVPSYLVQAFPNRIINIHPALLPKFGGKGMYGMHVHEAVKSTNEKETGITIHYVNERYDEGDIIFQASCPVDSEDTPRDIARKVQALEHRYFPEIIGQVCRKLG